MDGATYSDPSIFAAWDMSTSMGRELGLPIVPLTAAAQLYVHPTLLAMASHLSISVSPLSETIGCPIHQAVLPSSLETPQRYC